MNSTDRSLDEGPEPPKRFGHLSAKPFKMAPIHDVESSDGMNIPQGAFLSNKAAKYLFVEKIGQGGYGAVYKVQLDPSDNREYAMKVEKKLERREHSKLNMEVHILKLMGNKPDDKTHFLKMFDRGKKSKFFFIVMTLVGDSVLDLKRRRCPAVFSPATGLKVAVQCLEAIEELHSVGFIHRDIKPGNYAVGLFPRHTRIFILDFGIARRFTNDKSEVKAPRVKVAFKGTVRYAPLSCHKSKECGPRDDCESWIYMVVDCCNPDGIFWRKETERERVYEAKEDARTLKGKERLFNHMSLTEWSKILDYVDNLQYQDKVDYTFLYRMLDEAGKSLKVAMNALYDWEVADDRSGTEDCSHSTGTGGTSASKNKSTASMMMKK